MQFTPHYSFLHIHNLGNVFYIFLPGYGVLSSSRLSVINLLKFLNPFLHFLTLYWASAMGYRAGKLGVQKWMSPAIKGFRVNQGKHTWKQVGRFVKKYPGSCGRGHLWWVKQGFPLPWVPWLSHFALSPLPCPLCPVSLRCWYFLSHLPHRMWDQTSNTPERYYSRSQRTGLCI